MENFLSADRAKEISDSNVVDIEMLRRIEAAEYSFVIFGE